MSSILHKKVRTKTFMHDMDKYKDWEVDQEVNDWITTCENILEDFNIIKIQRDVITEKHITLESLYIVTSIIHEFYANDNIMKKYNKLNNKEEK